MRIRTDGDKGYRKDVIDSCSNFYGCNKTDAVVWAAHDVPGLVRACERVLSRDDLTVEQKREIADELNDNVRGVSFNVEHSVSVDS